MDIALQMEETFRVTVELDMVADADASQFNPHSDRPCRCTQLVAPQAEELGDLAGDSQPVGPRAVGDEMVSIHKETADAVGFDEGANNMFSTQLWRPAVIQGPRVRQEGHAFWSCSVQY